MSIYDKDITVWNIAKFTAYAGLSFMSLIVCVIVVLSV